MSTMLSSSGQEQLSTQELVQLCAYDPLLFCSTFFRETFRQDFASFHRDMWDVLEDRQHRYVAFSIFRGGAKTTTLRTFLAKRIAYGTARTALFVSSAQDHSVKSLAWLKYQIEYNKVFAQTFGLTPGSKWTDTEIRIDNKLLKQSTSVIALGMTGQIRGTLAGDYRPDLIVVDDPCDEENTATAEQRKKTADLLFGALDKSLAPESECADAKMALLQTVLNPEDLISMCLRDETWASRIYGCFDDRGNSTWPKRFPREILERQKQAHISRGQLPLWLREMECKIVSEESSDFRGSWLRYYDVLPENMVCFLCIDPVPPPSEREINTGCMKKDYEVLAVVGVHGTKRFVLEYSMNRGHQPEWTVTEFFRLVDKWRPLKARVEGTAYQRTLKWILDQEMKKRNRFVQVNAETDKRKKRQRIIQAFSGLASSGQLYVRQDQTEFYEQFVSYPNVAHDDLLDCVAMGLDTAAQSFDYMDPDAIPQGQESGALTEQWRVCP